MAAATRALGRWRWRAALVAVAIIALVAVIATRGSAAQDGNYRTAIVDTGDVTQTLTATGSIESASRYDVTFQVAGTVDEVNVAVGDTVEAGQELATLDESDLQDAVDAAEDALTEAQNTLADDLDAQANGSSTSSSSSGSQPSGGASTPSGGNSAPSGGSGGSGGSNSSGGSGGSGTSEAVKAAEQAVVGAQNALLEQYDATTAALATASASQATAQASCAAFTAMDPTDADAATALAQCQADTSTALGDQQAAASEQSTLMDKVTALNSAVTDLVNAINGTSSAAPAAYVTDTGESTTIVLAAYTTASVASATDDFGGSGASGSTNSSGGVPSAEDILADRADVAAAQADLLVAEAQLDYATLSTPVAGKVVSVGVASGDSVSAADTSTAITVIADNTYLVNLSVSLTQARMLSVGDAARLTLLSDNQVVDGTVSSVGTVNSGNSFQQSYAVTIAVPDPGFEIRIGTATRMAITVASATGAIVVPTSAVSDATGDATVQVIGDDGMAQTVSVTTGAVGSEYTEITSGLEKGQQVILADLSIKLSSGDDSSSSTGGLLSGLGDDSSTTDQRQFPGGGDFQPPDGFQPPAGFGGQGG